jgi:hypothetical protein
VLLLRSDSIRVIRCARSASLTAADGFLHRMCTSAGAGRPSTAICGAVDAYLGVTKDEDLLTKLNDERISEFVKIKVFDVRAAQRSAAGHTAPQQQPAYSM